MFNSGMFSADKLNSLKGGLTRLFHLYLEKTKLTVAERLSLLLAAGVMIFICSLLAIIGMVFASGALIEAAVAVDFTHRIVGDSGRCVSSACSADCASSQAVDI